MDLGCNANYFFYEWGKRMVTVKTNSSCTVDLPTFGKVHFAPFLNIGTVADIEKIIPEERSSVKIVDIIFSNMAKIENKIGEVRSVTEDDVRKFTDKDRNIFAQEFLKVMQINEAKFEGLSSPIEALAAYAISELQAAQKMQEEISNMFDTGFSQKTIKLFEENKQIAKQIASINKFRNVSGLNNIFLKSSLLGNEFDKVHSSMNFKIAKAGLQSQKKSDLNDSMKFNTQDIHTTEPFKKESWSFLDESSSKVTDPVDYHAPEPIAGGIKGLAQTVKGLPPIKTVEQIMHEQISLLKDDLGNRMDRVGNGIAGISLQQENTNSLVISALGDMRSKWKEDEKSSRVALWIAAFSLICSIFLTGYGIYQDRENNISSDKYQEQITKLMRQQNELSEMQRQLLDQIAKNSLKLPTSLDDKKR